MTVLMASFRVNAIPTSMPLLSPAVVSLTPQSQDMGTLSPLLPYKRRIIRFWRLQPKATYQQVQEEVLTTLSNVEYLSQVYFLSYSRQVLI
jgi:hypothetical protein